MSRERVRKHGQNRKAGKNQRKGRRAKQEKAKLIASEAVDRVGTCLFLDYFVPHYIEPSFMAACSVLAASVVVFFLRMLREMKG